MGLNLANKPAIQTIHVALKKSLSVPRQNAHLLEPNSLDGSLNIYSSFVVLL